VLRLSAQRGIGFIAELPGWDHDVPVHTSRSCLVVAAFAVVAALTFVSPPVPARAAVASWTEIELRPLHPGEDALVQDINNAGTSVGFGGTDAIKWDSTGNPTRLPVPSGCEQSLPWFINNRGDIAGFSLCGSAQPVATIWDANGTVSAGPAMFPTAFNDGDVLAGVTDPAEGHAVFATPGNSPQRLSEGGADTSFAAALTNTHLAVGSVTYTNPSTGHVRQAAVGWYGPYVFPFLPGNVNTTHASAANDAGYVVVSILPPVGTAYSVIVAPNGRVFPLGANNQDVGFDINNAGGVIGLSRVAGATLYLYGASVPISDLLAPSAPIRDLLIPAAINDNFWIVGRSATQTNGRSWLLRPPS
jgi:hypothetical protein